LAKALTFDIPALLVIPWHGPGNGHGSIEAVAFPDREPTAIRRRGVPRESWDELLEEPAHTVPPARLSAAVVEKQVSLAALRAKSTDRAKPSQRGCDPQRGSRIRSNADCRTECHTSRFARPSGSSLGAGKRKRTYPVEDYPPETLRSQPNWPP